MDCSISIRISQGSFKNYSIAGTNTGIHNALSGRLNVFWPVLECGIRKERKGAAKVHKSLEGGWPGSRILGLKLGYGTVYSDQPACRRQVFGNRCLRT